MAQIDKTTQFDQRLSVTAEDGGTVNYATLSGSIDQYGVPSMSYYINDGVIYREHLSDFRTAWSAFQDTVFAEADKVANTVAEQRGGIMGFFPHDLAGWLTVVGSLSGAMWFVIKMTFVKSINSLNKTIAGLENTLKSYDRRIAEHETRIRLLEDWREHHDDNE